MVVADGPEAALIGWPKGQFRGRSHNGQPTNALGNRRSFSMGSPKKLIKERIFRGRICFSPLLSFLVLLLFGEM